MPRLDTAEEASGNIYDTLLPDDEQGEGGGGGVEPSHDQEEDEEEEVKYEEIDKAPRSMVYSQKLRT